MFANRGDVLYFYPKLSFKRYQGLKQIFRTLDDAWSAHPSEFQRAGWDDKTIADFSSWKTKVNEEELYTSLTREQIQLIPFGHTNYPKLLAQIFDPPICLFVQGELKEEKFSLAVVGARKSTAYGEQVTADIIAPLASMGITIVSGLALGIDSLAHQITLQNQGRTLAVLGGGIDKNSIMPRQNLRLASEIVAHGGAVISEYPPGTVPNHYTFPKRNRIIAGLALGTLVIEAAEGSGSLITASCALDNGREVFAIPQNITSPSSFGTNTLIKHGAKPVTRYTDILEALNLTNVREFVHNEQVLPASPTEEKLLQALSREPLHVDILIKQTGIPSHTIMSTLTLMEMKGMVKHLGGMSYVIGR